MKGLDFFYFSLLLRRFLFLLLLRFWWLLNLLWFLLCRYYCCSLHFRLLFGFWLLLHRYCWNCSNRSNRNILWRRRSVGRCLCFFDDWAKRVVSIWQNIMLLHLFGQRFEREVKLASQSDFAFIFQQVLINSFAADVKFLH